MKQRFFKIQNSKFKIPAKGGKGFTLIEVIVSVLVLTVGTFTAVALITDNLRVAQITKNSVIAAHLAQEGAEVVRGLRDANWIQNNAYDDGLADGTYCVNFNSTELISCSPSFNLFWDGSNYAHTGATATPFEREINITRPQDSDGIEYLRIQSIVRWDSRETVVETHLYDWR